MKLLNLASNNSFWRGIDYHHENRIISWKELAGNCYQGKVRGSGNAVYDVTIDTAHPRKSACNCPFAEGRRVICKHMIALGVVFDECNFHDVFTTADIEKILKGVYKTWDSDCKTQKYIKYYDTINQFEDRQCPEDCGAHSDVNKYSLEQWDTLHKKV